MAASPELIAEVTALLTDNEKPDVFEALCRYYSDTDFGSDDENNFARFIGVRLNDLYIHSCDAKVKLGF